jgi:hypothetical protein
LVEHVENNERPVDHWVPVNSPEVSFEPVLFQTADGVTRQACGIPLPTSTVEEEIFFTDEKATELACRLPLPGPTSEEELFFTEEMMTAMDGAGREDDHFGSETLFVPGGVAVTEEGVEIGVAHIATQV